MTRDEQMFPEPEIFRPERHEAKLAGSESTGVEYGQNDPSAIIFGFGRRCALGRLTVCTWMLTCFVIRFMWSRACPGKAFAETIFFLTFANVLSAFDIQPYTNPVTGKMERPEQAFETTMVRWVLPRGNAFRWADRAHEVVSVCQSRSNARLFLGAQGTRSWFGSWTWISRFFFPALTEFLLFQDYLSQSVSRIIAEPEKWHWFLLLGVYRRIVLNFRAI